MARRTSRSRALAPIAAALTAAAALLAGCGGSDATTPAGSSAGHGAHGAGADAASTASPAAPASAQPSTALAVHNDADVMFAQMMTPHHQQAVEMANLAPTRAADPQVKQLAARIKAAQGPEIAQMSSWLSAWEEAYPMDGDHASHGGMAGMMTEDDMEALAQAKGRDFDRRFLTMMVAHHQGALEMARAQAAEGQNAEAKALAQRVVVDQQREIEEMGRLIQSL